MPEQYFDMLHRGDEDEPELIRRARQKDNAAVRILIQQHNRRLYRLARSILRNDSEAEDVVQEAYIRAFTNLAKFRGDSSLASPKAGVSQCLQMDFSAVFAAGDPLGRIDKGHRCGNGGARPDYCG